MLSRSATATLSLRSSSMRRQRRLNAAATSQLFCRTNGCPSFMVLDPATGIATCPICGLQRHIN